MLVRTLYDWITLQDYEDAKADATERVVKRLARGNVSAQNGWYMSDSDLEKLSKCADVALDKLENRLASCPT